MMMAGGSYRFVPRPSGTSHQHPYLVFDHQDRLHFHLTIFGKEAVSQQSDSTARTYLYAVLPFLSFDLIRGSSAGLVNPLACFFSLFQ